jgi:hypothetical protein
MTYVNAPFVLECRPGERREGNQMLVYLTACFVTAVPDRITDPDKMVHDYEWFHTAHERFGARTAQVASTAAAFAEEQDAPERSRLRIDLDGQRQSCRELVADYNANAEKVTMGSFRGWSLPARLDPESCEVH